MILGAGRILCALLVVGLAGCVHQAARIDHAPQALPSDLFAAPIGDGFVRTPMETESDRYTTERVRYPARRPDCDKNAMMGAVLRIPTTRPRGLIAVLPILGGDYAPSDAFATYLAEAGFTTLRFDRKHGIFDPQQDFAHVAEVFREGVVDVRRGVAWAEREHLQGRGKIGVLGISMGSFVGTIVAATDPRISAAALALGGADLPVILESARSEEEIDALFTSLEARGWSPERIRAAAAKDLAPVEPERYAPALDPRSTLMIHARFDQVVPFVNGQRLWRASGRPRRIVTFTGHYTSVLLIRHLMREVEAHFTRQLDPRPPERYDVFR